MVSLGPVLAQKIDVSDPPVTKSPFLPRINRNMRKWREETGSTFPHDVKLLEFGQRTPPPHTHTQPIQAWPRPRSGARFLHQLETKPFTSRFITRIVLNKKCSPHTDFGALSSTPPSTRSLSCHLLWPTGCQCTDTGCHHTPTTPGILLNEAFSSSPSSSICPALSILLHLLRPRS